MTQGPCPLWDIPGDGVGKPAAGPRMWGQATGSWEGQASHMWVNSCTLHTVTVGLEELVSEVPREPRHVDLFTASPNP